MKYYSGFVRSFMWIPLVCEWTVRLTKMSVHPPMPYKHKHLRILILQNSFLIWVFCCLF